MRLIDADKLCEDLLDRWSIADKRKEELIRRVMADIVTPIIASQPTIEPEPQWIPKTKKHPPKRKHIWITDVYGDVEVVYRGDGRLWISDGDNGYVEDEIIAWMLANVPLPYREEGEKE